MKWNWVYNIDCSVAPFTETVTTLNNKCPIEGVKKGKCAGETSKSDCQYFMGIRERNKGCCSWIRDNTK